MNDIETLRSRMFEQLERLADPKLTPQQLKIEFDRAIAMKELGKVVVESVKAEMQFAKLTGARVPEKKEITEPEKKEIPEPVKRRPGRPKREKTEEPFVLPKREDKPYEFVKDNLY